MANYCCRSCRSRKTNVIFAVILGLAIPLMVYKSTQFLEDTGKNIASDTVYYRPRKSVLDYNPVSVLKAPPVKYLNNVENPCFYENGKLHCLPKIFVIGFTKAGTTDLNYRITRHQWVYSGRDKEPHWWDIQSKSNTLEKYVSKYESVTQMIESICQPGRTFSRTVVSEAFRSRRFPPYLSEAQIQDLSSTINNDRVDKPKCPLLTIDATPRTMYMSFTSEDAAFHNTTLQKRQTGTYLIPQKIHHLVPDARIIISLRNPTDRLFSDYKYFGRGQLSADHFDRMVRTAMNWWQRCLGEFKLSLKQCTLGNKFPPKLGHPGSGNKPLALDIYNQSWHEVGAERLRIGVYSVYLTQWFAVFPRSNFYISKFEQFVSNTTHYMTQEIYPFLKLPVINQTGLKQLNKSEDTAIKIKKDKPGRSFEMKAKTRTLLNQFYAPYNKKLADLLQDDYYRSW